MKLISLLNNISVDNSNKETIKSVAVQGLIEKMKKWKLRNLNKKL